MILTVLLNHSAWRHNPYKDMSPYGHDFRFNKKWSLGLYDFRRYYLCKRCGTELVFGYKKYNKKFKYGGVFTFLNSRVQAHDGAGWLVGRKLKTCNQIIMEIACE